MKYYIILLLIPLVLSYPYYYYPQQMPVFYGQSFYNQRYNIPSNFYNNHYQQPCYRCPNLKNGMFMTSQQQYGSYNNDNANVPKYNGEYNIPKLENEYNDGQRDSNRYMTYPSGYLNSDHMNDNTNVNTFFTQTTTMSTDLSKSIPNVDQRTVFIKGQEELILPNDNNKLSSVQEQGQGINNLPEDGNKFDKIEIPTSISTTQYHEDIPTSTTITKDLSPESSLINSPTLPTFPVSNNNKESGELSNPKIEFNTDTGMTLNTETKSNKQQTSVIVDSKKDADYVLYQEVPSPTTSTKNNETDFYDVTVSVN